MNKIEKTILVMLTMLATGFYLLSTYGVSKQDRNERHLEMQFGTKERLSK